MFSEASFLLDRRILRWWHSAATIGGPWFAERRPVRGALSWRAPSPRIGRSAEYAARGGESSGDRWTHLMHSTPKSG